MADELEEVDPLDEEEVEGVVDAPMLVEERRA